MKITTAKVAIATTLILVAQLTAFADRQSYTPPAQKGVIYVVVRYRVIGAMVPQPTRWSVSWGGYNRSGTTSPPMVLPGRAVGAKGFVLRLDHRKNDSMQISVETDGRIVQGPYQGDPPSEWSDGDYKRVSL